MQKEKNCKRDLPHLLDRDLEDKGRYFFLENSKYYNESFVIFCFSVLVIFIEWVYS